MKTTQGKALRALRALIMIRDRRDYSTRETAKKLFDLKKQLEKAYEFQREQEALLAEQYSITIDEQGRFMFTGDDAERRDGFIREMQALADLEIDVDFEPYTVGQGELEHTNMDDMEALADFIQFT